MVTILHNLTGMTVHDGSPSTHKNLTESTAVSRIKYYRNQIVHSSTGQLSDNEFNIIFDDIVEVILYIYCMLVREIWKIIHPRVSYSLRATPEGNMILVGGYTFIFPEPACYECFIIPNETKKTTEAY